ncbi:hypothetical protein [Amycolatopsis sp. CA-128772]|uniref:hypothetical protein n=1 Tax=Amycolatopsis sp. CA-128772 TaxID=2073159 RepID=UPI000CD2E801|nr:hypothetical protein [Amycolatopsis sp. CA-128772]
MTGPEHYREAERLIRTADRSYNDAEFALAEAQIHATLALAAATASAGRMNTAAVKAWDQVTGRTS